MDQAILRKARAGSVACGGDAADYTQCKRHLRRFCSFPMPLILDIGRCDRSTQPNVITGNCLILVPESRDEGHGVLLACAEGIGERPAPEQAAKTAVAALGDGYYAASADQPLRQALEESLNAAHQMLSTGGERGRAATVAAVALRGRRWLTGHAGNIRAWLYRDLQLKQLTRDHVLPRLTQRAEITKACGLSNTFEADYSSGDICAGDIFVLTSANVHDVVPSPVIIGVLQSNSTAQQMAEAIAQHALNARAKGYVGVCVAYIERLPSAAANNAGEAASALPVIEPPAIGTTIDGFVIEALAHKSRRFRLYKAIDTESNSAVVLRFPNPSFYRQPRQVQTFLREEWIGKRIDSPHIAKTLALRPGRRTALYSVMQCHDGENLAKRIRRKHGLPPLEALQLGEQLLQALETLHSEGIIHRDVRPNNLTYDKPTHTLRLIGIGSSRVEALQDSGVGPSSSALSYTAPELFKNAPATESSDIYAAGVTIYRMLTAGYPYGKIETPETAGQNDYAPLSHYKAGLTETGLDEVLRRACASTPADRYSSAAQFNIALMNARAAFESTTTQRMTSTTAAAWRHWPAWVATAGLLAAFATYLYLVLR
jgi:serine/threonine protein phosphatase PrpC